ncbi:MAG: hypothetical protein R2838_15015 [Caldilineaceae bacterium]
MLGAHSRNLLLIGRDARMGRLLPLIDAMLDHGGRVTVVLVAADGDRVRRDLMRGCRWRWNCTSQTRRRGWSKWPPWPSGPTRSVRPCPMRT